MLLAAVAVWAVTVVALFRLDDVRMERRVYWIGILGGGALGVIALQHRGIGTSVAAFAVITAIAVWRAYYSTDYLVIGGKVRSLTRIRGDRTVRHESYGGISAAAFWWLMVVLAAIAAANVLPNGWTANGIAAVSAVSVVSAGIGFTDGREKAPPVRRQYLQAVVFAALAIPAWGIPVAAYVLLYGLRDSSVELRDVTFRYATDGPDVLRGVSVRVEPGTVTAVIGTSGSGKSTLVRLISRFFDVTGGAVLVGGVDVRSISEQRLAGQIGQIFQDTYLFQGTVADNIRIGKPDATDDEILAVAQRAGSPISSNGYRMAWTPRWARA
ncbi:ATP-binding cassette domain-containing protein [Mycobacterium sp. GA-2829]|uniref:ATP-binding cassette domain-containing protein n=1 Tax=Mycobacterium sp. GA-2829 TaxID=1772283 RepID=UPI0018D26BAA|nr:ATP-binding cassette domain-containing protein [Mycobacterium sp. GA-2829]